MSTDREPAGRKVGEQFVGVFFNCLANQPKDLTNFFTKESQASIGDTDSYPVSDRTVKGDDIASSIAERFQDAIMKVLSIDIHCTATRSIIIMVIGQAEFDDGNRDFAFTFNLESRNLHGVGERYFLLNCILRFLGASSPSVSEPQAVQEPPKEQSPAAVPVEVKSSPVQTPQEPKKKPEAKPAPKEAAQPAQPAQKTAKSQDNAKPSYASVVKPQSDVEEVQETRSTSAPPTTPQTQAQQQSSSQKQAKGRAGVDMAQSLFVSGTPGKISEESVLGVVSLFGDIKSIRVFDVKGHAFVEFTSEEAVQKALTAFQENGPIPDANGVPLSFEERKPPNRGSKPAPKRRGGGAPNASQEQQRGSGGRQRGGSRQKK